VAHEFGIDFEVVQRFNFMLRFITQCIWHFANTVLLTNREIHLNYQMPVHMACSLGSIVSTSSSILPPIYGNYFIFSNVFVSSVISRLVVEYFKEAFVKMKP
jgi:hypothetical protein